MRPNYPSYSFLLLNPSYYRWQYAHLLGFGEITYIWVDGWWGTMEAIESCHRKMSPATVGVLSVGRRDGEVLWCGSLTNRLWQDQEAMERIRAVCTRLCDCTLFIQQNVTELTHLLFYSRTHSHLVAPPLKCAVEDRCLLINVLRIKLLQGSNWDTKRMENQNCGWC